MECSICLYNNNCSLQDIAKDILGCTGHSKLRPPKEGQIQCESCKGWFDEDRMFKRKNSDTGLCFDCY